MYRAVALFKSFLVSSASNAKGCSCVVSNVSTTCKIYTNKRNITSHFPYPQSTTENQVDNPLKKKKLMREAKLQGHNQYWFFNLMGKNKFQVLYKNIKYKLVWPLCSSIVYYVIQAGPISFNYVNSIPISFFFVFFMSCFLIYTFFKTKAQVLALK